MLDESAQDITWLNCTCDACVFVAGKKYYFINVLFRLLYSLDIYYMRGSITWFIWSKLTDSLSVW